MKNKMDIESNEFKIKNSITFVSEGMPPTLTSHFNDFPARMKYLKSVLRHIIIKA